jgi:HNH endonuclease
MSDIPTKRCSACGEEKPATPEFFYRNKGMRDGLLLQCKACRSRKQKEWFSRPEVKERQLSKQKERYHSPGEHERTLAQQKAYRQAHKEQRSASAKHYYQKKGEHVRARVNSYRQRNSEQLNEKKRAYYALPEVREHKRTYDRAYKKRPQVRERLRIYQRNYHRHPYHRIRKTAYEQAYRQRPEVKARMHAYYKTHGKAYFNRSDVKQRARVNGHIRRARMRAVSGTHTSAQIREMLQRHRYRCYYCRTKLQKSKKHVYGYDFHIEHTFPISRVAGISVPANDISYLVPACPHCNDSKREKFPWEWPEGGRLF